MRETCAFYGTAFAVVPLTRPGYTGLGVGTTWIGANVMLDLLDGDPTERTELAMVRTTPIAVPARAPNVPQHPVHPLVTRPRRNTWRRMDFSGADFRAAVSWMAIYEDCDFSGTKLAKVKFEHCALTRCRSAGGLREVVFDGRDLTDRPAPPPMDKVDFSDATFRQVEFMGFDLDGVTLPNDPDIHLLRRARCVARCGVEMLDGDDRLEARMLRAMLENQLRGPGTDHEARVFNRRDYLELGGPQLLALAEDVLTLAEGDCLS